MIKATAVSSHYNMTVTFDATDWFAEASDKELLILDDIGWGGDIEAENVAVAMQKNDANLARFFKTMQASSYHDLHDFSCRIDRRDAVRWLKQNRPAVWALLREEEKALVS